ncbi:MAG: hypothetical protein QHH09_01275 [Microgenomates group bacterium]|nr:hypothetical protein [Microgenomates group bacterium]
MEKTIVFLPIIIFFGFFGLLIIGFFALVAKLFFKAKAQEWEGEVIDKGHHIEEEKDKYGLKKTHHLYSLKVRLDNGEIHNIPATADFYQKIKVGDRLKKEKGSLWPKKIS